MTDKTFKIEKESEGFIIYLIKSRGLRIPISDPFPFLGDALVALQMIRSKYYE